VVYVYFDYKAQESQTRMNITRSLLKQILYRSHDIPPALERLYESSIQHNTQLELRTLDSHLTSCFQESPVYAVFDAMDECSDDYQEEMVSFFSKLQNSGCRLLISTRPHLLALRNQLDVCAIDITANAGDLREYIIKRLKKATNKNPTLETKCLELIKKVDGMYVLVS
jgi:hypothetical protein